MPLDIGVGLLLGVLLSSITTLDYGICLGLGVLAALLPDLDFLWKIIQTRSLPNTEHRDSLHYPILFIPIVGLVGLLVSLQVSLILMIGAFAHFLHDSIGIGFGVKWLFPFKKNSYLFLFQIRTPASRDMPKQRLYSWNDTERTEMIKKYAYPDWISYVYLRPNPWGTFEYLIFLIGAVVAFMQR